MIVKARKFREASLRVLCELLSFRCESSLLSVTRKYQNTGNDVERFSGVSNAIKKLLLTQCQMLNH
jgi:hypothetical protein